MSKTLNVLVVVYVAGVVLTKLTIDTSPQSDHRVSLGWPYYLAKDPVQFTTGVRSAIEGAIKGAVNG